MIWTSSELGKALRAFRGLTLLGVVDDGAGCVEIVFSGPAQRLNLLSLFDNGVLELGHVEEPDRYLKSLA